MVQEFRNFHASMVSLDVNRREKKRYEINYLIYGTNKRVFCRAKNVLIKNAVFVVNERIRKTVVSTHSREIHAGIRGEVVIDPLEAQKVLSGADYGIPVYYNPFEVDRFVVGLKAIVSASYVFLTNEGTKPKINLYGFVKFDDKHDVSHWKNNI